MIDFLKNLLGLKSNSQLKTNESRHFKNINAGHKIYLDGKSYVKVKLRFVDTLNYDATQHLDQLETEIDFQKLEIEKLLLLIDNFETRIETLQILNINLLNESRINTNKLNKTIASLTHENENKMTYSLQLENTYQNLNKSTEDFKNQIEQLKITLGSKDNRIASLEQQVHFLESTKQNSISSKKGFVRLRDALHAAENELVSKNNEIENMDKFIAVMTQKILEKESKIHELETLLNPPKKK